VDGVACVAGAMRLDRRSIETISQKWRIKTTGCGQGGGGGLSDSGDGGGGESGQAQ